MPEKPNFYSQTEPSERAPKPTILLDDEERQILIWVARGFTNMEIAHKMGLSRKKFKQDKLAVITNKLLEKTREGALARALMTRQIGISEVMPEGYPLELRTNVLLQSDKKTKAWAALANPGTIPEVARFLPVGAPTLHNYSIEVYAALRVGSRAEAMVLYYGAVAEGLIPAEFEPAA